MFVLDQIAKIEYVLALKTFIFCVVCELSPQFAFDFWEFLFINQMFTVFSVLGTMY